MSFVGGKIEKKFMIEVRVMVLLVGLLLILFLMCISGLENRNIGRNLKLYLVFMIWGYFLEKGFEFFGKMYEGGIILLVYYVYDGEFGCRVILEILLVGLVLYVGLSLWVLGVDFKDWMMKYGRIFYLFVLVRDYGLGEVLKENEVMYRISKKDRENLRVGFR